MDDAQLQPDPVDPSCTLDTDPVQDMSKDLLAKSSRKEALRKGRSIGWSKKSEVPRTEEVPMSFETEQPRDPLSGIPTESSMDPHM